MILNYTVTEVAEEKRLDFLPSVIGEHFLSFERYVYNSASMMSKDYLGGFWKFFDCLGNTEEKTPFFFMAIDYGKPLNVSNELNQFSGTLSPKAFGVAITILALSSFLFDFESKGIPLEKLIDAFYELKDYAATLEEANLIYRFID